MRFGWCAGIGQASALAEAGYDYIELSVAGDLVPEEDEPVWREKRKLIEAMPLLPEAFNSFVRTGKIVGPEADTLRLQHYVETALARAAQVGGKIVVFGSGGARQIPEGFDAAIARRQLNDFLTYCAESSDRTGVTVVIEPLESAECNFINRVSEGADLARKLNRSGVRALADTWHMERESEPLEAIMSAAEVLAHVHTADTHRDAPGTGHYDHTALFDTLRAAHYDGRLSVECNAPRETFPFQAARSLAYLKKAASTESED